MNGTRDDFSEVGCLIGCKFFRRITAKAVMSMLGLQRRSSACRHFFSAMLGALMRDLAHFLAVYGTPLSSVLRGCKELDRSPGFGVAGCSTDKPLMVDFQ